MCPTTVTVVGILPAHTDFHECDVSTNTLVPVSAADDKLHSVVDRR